MRDRNFERLFHMELRYLDKAGEVVPKGLKGVSIPVTMSMCIEV